MPKQKLYNARQLGAYVGVSKQTAGKWIKRRKVPFMKRKFHVVVGPRNAECVSEATAIRIKAAFDAIEKNGYTSGRFAKLLAIEPATVSSWYANKYIPFMNLNLKLTLDCNGWEQISEAVAFEIKAAYDAVPFAGTGEHTDDEGRLCRMVNNASKKYKVCPETLYGWRVYCPAFRYRADGNRTVQTKEMWFKGSMGQLFQTTVWIDSDLQEATKEPNTVETEGSASQVGFVTRFEGATETLNCNQIRNLQNVESKLVFRRVSGAGKRRWLPGYSQTDIDERKVLIQNAPQRKPYLKTQWAKRLKIKIPTLDARIRSRIRTGEIVFGQDVKLVDAPDINGRVCPQLEITPAGAEKLFIPEHKRRNLRSDRPSLSDVARLLGVEYNDVLALVLRNGIRFAAKWERSIDCRGHERFMWTVAPQRVMLLQDDLGIAEAQCAVVTQVETDATVTTPESTPPAETSTEPDEAQREPVAQTENVKLFGPDEPPKVCGVPQKKLTKKRYKVVLALTEAANRGGRLSKNQLDGKTGLQFAYRILKGLRSVSPEWFRVIEMGEKTGGGYAIR